MKTDGMAAVWALVRTIPRGKVMSYGQVAEAVARAGITARVVGWAMAQCPEGVPWWRVVNVRGVCSVDQRDGAKRQQKLLEKEGVAFRTERVDMTRHRWVTE